MSAQNQQSSSNNTLAPEASVLKTSDSKNPATTITSTTQDNKERMAQLRQWLSATFDEQKFELTSLPGDASFRRYHRMKLLDNKLNDTSSVDTKDAVSDSSERYIIMDAPPQKESITEFVLVDEFMATAVNVTTIIAKDLTQGFLLLQDFGNTEFAHLLAQLPEDTQKSQKVDAYYQWAMRTLIDLQKLDIEQARQQANIPDYGLAKLGEEMALFTDWFLPYFDIAMPDAVQQIWHDMTQWISQQIMAQPQVVVHRDYHSRNLMLDREHPEQLGVIDFQDAVIGAYSYDVLSLLRDAYVSWDEQTIKGWAEDFWQYQQTAGLATAKSSDEFYQDMNIVGVQRHLKILGIFIRLAKRDGKLRYLADIAKVMQDLRFELDWLTKHSEPAIQRVFIPFADWFTAEVVPVYEQKKHLLNQS